MIALAVSLVGHSFRNTLGDKLGDKLGRRFGNRLGDKLGDKFGFKVAIGGSVPDVTGDETLEHLQSGVGLLVRHHVAGTINHVVSHVVVVNGDPGFQTAPWILDSLLGLAYLPAELFQVGFGFEGGHDCVDVAAEEHHFETCVLEGLEEGHRGGASFVQPVDFAAGCPVFAGYVQLLLHLRILQEIYHARVVSIAVGLIIVRIN